MGDYGEDSFNKLTGTAKEIVAILEAAVFAKGTPEGYLAESIMKKIRSKGFQAEDISVATISPEYKEDYFRVLTNEKVPFMCVRDVYGNDTYYINSEDREKFLNIDAAIKKSSQHITRQLYIKDFLKNEQRLGHKVVKFNLSSDINTDILSGKAFQNTHGFVSSFSNGCLYAKASDVDSPEFLNIMADTLISSSNSDSLLLRAKRAQKAGEDAVINAFSSELTHPSHDRMYFVNSENPHSTYAIVQDSKISIYNEDRELIKQIDATKLSPEALTDTVQNTIGQINNCTVMTEMDAGQWFQDFTVNAQTMDDRYARLAETVRFIDKGDKTEVEKYCAQNYLRLDKESLEKAMRIAHQRAEKAKEELLRGDISDGPTMQRLAEERDYWNEVQSSVNTLLTMSERKNNLLRELTKRFKMQCAMENIRLQSMTLDDRLKYEGQIYEKLLKTDDIVKDFKDVISDMDFDDIGRKMAEICESIDEANIDAELSALKNTTSSYQQAPSHTI